MIILQNIYREVASEYTRGAMIVSACQPTGRSLPGWGDPQSDYAGIRFRTAILQTVSVLEKAVPVDNFLGHTETDKAPSHPIPSSRSPRVSLLAKYIPLTQGEDPILPKSLRPLLLLYETHLENARWRHREPEQKDYEDCLRIVAVLVDVLGKRLLLSKQQEARTSST
jgi:hypothetical protein